MPSRCLHSIPLTIFWTKPVNSDHLRDRKCRQKYLEMSSRSKKQSGEIIRSLDFIYFTPNQ